MGRVISYAICDVGLFCAGGAVMFGLMSDGRDWIGAAGFVAAAIFVLLRPTPYAKGHQP